MRGVIVFDRKSFVNQSQPQHRYMSEFKIQKNRTPTSTQPNLNYRMKVAYLLNPSS